MSRGRQWYRVENAASGRASSAVLRIYDEIGGWFGVESAELVRELDALDVDEIELRLNSPGGSVYDGLAIMNSLRAHRARVVAHVDGMAASAASLIAVGGADEVVMGMGTELMVHNPAAMTRGDAATHRDSANRLDSIADSLAAVYRSKAGGELADWRAVMAAETWYSAAEAVAAGLADRVDESAEVDPDQVENAWDLSVYNFAGRRAAPAPPQASARGLSTERSGTVPTLQDEIRKRLGVAADADEATVLAALDEALEERAEETPAAASDAPELGEGVVAVDKAVLDELRTQAARGEQAAARQEADDRARLVDAAVRDGRIAPARRDAWIARLAADAGEAATLASLSPGLVPVNGAVGYGGDDDTEDDDADARLKRGGDLYGKRFGKNA